MAKKNKKRKTTYKRRKKASKWRLVLLAAIFISFCYLCVFVTNDLEIGDGSHIPSTYTVIDVSHHNGNINWSKASKKIDGAILRIGTRKLTSGKLVKDTKFDSNLKGVKKNHVNYGIYFYSGAVNKSEAIEEADYTIKLLKNSNISSTDLHYPIYYDLESNTRTENVSSKTYTDMALAYKERIEESGYTCEIYSYTSLIKSKLYSRKLKPYITWVAQYQSSLDYHNKYVKGWQYTDKGKVNGIYTKVDKSYFEY